MAGKLKLPAEKENHLTNLLFWGFQPFAFGCTYNFIFLNEPNMRYMRPIRIYPTNHQKSQKTLSTSMMTHDNQGTQYTTKGKITLSSAFSRSLQKVQLLWTVMTSWWLNQPIWKICSSNWVISPRLVVIKYLEPPRWGPVVKIPFFADKTKWCQLQPWSILKENKQRFIHKSF